MESDPAHQWDRLDVAPDGLETLRVDEPGLSDF
jgi:hypothetical protein